MCPTFQSVWSQAWPAAAQVILCWPPGHPGQPVCWTAQHVEMSHFTVCMGFPETSVGKETACNAGDPASIPGLGRSPGEGKCYPLQFSGLENSIDCIVHGVAESQTWLSNFHFYNIAVLLYYMDLCVYKSERSESVSCLVMCNSLRPHGI